MKRTIVKHLLLLLLLFAGKTTFAQWARVYDIDSFPRCRETTFVIGDTAYLGKGDAYSFGYVADFHAYTSNSNTWNPAPSYTGNTGDQGFSFVINNKAYVGAGANYSCFNDFHSYDPSTGTWSPLANLPGVGRAFAAGFSIGNKGYAGTGGGCSAGNINNDFYQYNVSTNTWNTKASLPVARYGAAAFSVNGKGYMGLGSSTAGQGQMLRDMYQYDTLANTWTAMASMPSTFGMEEPSYFVLCGKLIVTLGDTLHTSVNITNRVWMFDPSDGPIGKWYQLPDFPGASAYSAQGFALKDTGYVYGGFINNGVISQMFRYVPNINPLTVSTPVTICSGASTILTADGGGAFKWSPSAGLSDSVTTSTSASGGITQVTASPSVTTTYTITEAVCGQTATIVVNVGSAQADTVKATPSTICSGYNSTLTVTGTGSFTWSPSTGLMNTTGNTVVASPSVTTTYTVSTGNGGCAFNGTVVVQVGNSAVGGHVTALRDTICQGTPGNLTLAGSSGINLQWQSSADGNNFNNAGDTTTKYKTTPLLQSAWYRVTVGSGSCSAISDTLKLVVPPALTAFFNSTQSSGSVVTFNCDSSAGNIRSYHWDFGDGNTSNEQNPSHTFAKDSTYYVCLTLYDGSNCSYTFCRYTDVTDGVPTISGSGNWVIYPNPFNEQLTVSSKQTNSQIQSIEMYDVLGQLALHKNNTATSLQLDVSALAKGMYYVMIKTADADYVQKVVKQ